MSNTTLFITHAGIAAEQAAKANNTEIKITSVVVDELPLPESQDPRNLTKVQRNPLDQNEKPAIYPIAGDSLGNTVTLAWALPATSGGYDIGGLGFVLEDGTLWGYQRANMGFKPNPDDNAFFEPHGTITHVTSAASNITVDIKLTEVGATLDDVRYQVHQHETMMRQLMRKMEGKLGRVRLYMANDVDEDYLPISGQTILKADYPDYFKHLGITTDRLTLPDWGEHGYIRQFSDSLTAGMTLEEEIKAHKHGIDMDEAGKYTPKFYPIKLGSKSTTISLDGKFQTEGAGSHSHNASSKAAGGHSHGASSESSGAHAHAVGINANGSHSHSATTNNAGNHNHSGNTDQSGSHTHSGSTNSAGEHAHSRGSMNIKGNLTFISETWGAYGKGDGVFIKKDGYRNGKTPKSTDSSNTGGVEFDASRGWSGYTSREGNHDHLLSINANGMHTHSLNTNTTGAHSHAVSVASNGSHSHTATVKEGGSHSHTIKVNSISDHAHEISVGNSGSHTHYVNVSFKDKKVTIDLGEYTPKAYDVAAHKHKITMRDYGGDETRPKTTVAVYAVKVKYLVDL